jgi:hypothetical protein
MPSHRKATGSKCSRSRAPDRHRRVQRHHRPRCPGRCTRQGRLRTSRGNSHRIRRCGRSAMGYSLAHHDPPADRDKGAPRGRLPRRCHRRYRLSKNSATAPAHHTAHPRLEWPAATRFGLGTLTPSGRDSRAAPTSCQRLPEDPSPSTKVDRGMHNSLRSGPQYERVRVSVRPPGRRLGHDQLVLDRGRSSESSLLPAAVVGPLDPPGRDEP